MTQHFYRQANFAYHLEIVWDVRKTTYTILSSVNEPFYIGTKNSLVSFFWLSFFISWGDEKRRFFFFFLACTAKCATYQHLPLPPSDEDPHHWGSPTMTFLQLPQAFYFFTCISRSLFHISVSPNIIQSLLFSISAWVSTRHSASHSPLLTHAVRNLIFFSFWIAVMPYFTFLLAFIRKFTFTF